MSSSKTVLEPSRTTQLHTRIFGRGSSRDTSSPHPGESPLVILRVQVISCQNLESKDRNGYSDPFVTVSIFGKQFSTPVCKRNLNPIYAPKDATFDFPVYTSLVHKFGSTLEFVVWDKDTFGKDFLGKYALPANRWFKGTAIAFDDRDNQHFSVTLGSSSSTTTARGTMYIKVGFVQPPNLRSLPDFEKTYDALMNVNPDSAADKDIVVLQIHGAKNLPKWPNVTLTGWDMDPYVQVSIGGEVKCTRVIQHSRDPVWDQQLLFHVREHDLSQPIQLTVFDWDRFTSDDYVGEAVITIESLLEGSVKKDLNTWLYPDELQSMIKFELPLTPSKKPGRVYKPIPTITFYASYQSSVALQK